ncbi:MAG: AsnC family protein [Planctomycetaceae bacterium]|nr:AsnC family protein [Planctomycetaceae bacterium]
MVKSNKISPEELDRRADSVLRCLQENPGLSAADIGRRLGDVSGRQVRERIHNLRDRGHAITIAENGKGYILLDRVESEQRRASLVKAHRSRTRCYLSDHAKLMTQITGMSATAVAELTMFDQLISVADEEADADRPSTWAEIAKLPVERRTGLFSLLRRMLVGIKEDPVAFAAERTCLADEFGAIFLTKADKANLDKARQLLQEIGA